MQHQLTCLGFLYGIWHSLSSHDAVNFEGVYYYIIMNQMAFLLHQCHLHINYWKKGSFKIQSYLNFSILAFSSSCMS